MSYPKSTNDLDKIFKIQLANISKNLKKKTQKTGVSAYLDDNVDDDDDLDSYDDEDDDVFNKEGDKSMTGQKDPRKLIDLELVNLLKFCNNLKTKHKETDEYQDEIMDKALELGKQVKEKTLILDMDETMIAAKFDGKEPKNFKPSFSFDYSG